MIDNYDTILVYIYFFILFFSFYIKKFFMYRMNEISYNN